MWTLTKCHRSQSSSFADETWGEIIIPSFMYYSVKTLRNPLNLPYGNNYAVKFKQQNAVSVYMPQGEISFSFI